MVESHDAIAERRHSAASQDRFRPGNCGRSKPLESKIRNLKIETRFAERSKTALKDRQSSRSFATLREILARNLGLTCTWQATWGVALAMPTPSGGGELKRLRNLKRP
jgi:hypothetical protein